MLANLARLTSLAVLGLVLVGCEDRPDPLVPPSDVRHSQAEATSGYLVTSDAAEFAAALRGFDNENRAAVVVRSATVPPISTSPLRAAVPNIPGAVAVPRAVGPLGARSETGFPEAGDAALEAVLALLAEFGVEPYQPRYVFPVYSVKLPDEGLTGIVSALLAHPNVDRVSASLPRPAYPRSGPVGSNPTDTKHDMHDVQEAWAYTRGNGAWVGILDSGLAHDTNTGLYHEDARGFHTRGFSDRYGDCAGDDHEFGNCVTWDDHGHGTHMAGLMGADDNDLGYVGIMPAGTRHSLKITHNSNVSNHLCRDMGEPRMFCIEDNDFRYAVDWAAKSGVQVLSMSFGYAGSDQVRDALARAYNTYDVLLLAAVANVATDPLEEPASLSYVMGIGGVDASGNRVGVLEHREASAFSYGWTTQAACSGWAFCTPDGYATSSGTSAATATAAGIAGLVRSYHSTMTAPEVRQRLIEFSSGSYNIVNAHAAIVGPTLTARILGPTDIATSGEYTWTADPSGGDGTYAYEWFYRIDHQTWTCNYQTDWSFVGSDATYSRNVPVPSYDFRIGLRVTSGGETAWTEIKVYVADSDQMICPMDAGEDPEEG
jgi:hypothetical protein